MVAVRRTGRAIAVGFGAGCMLLGALIIAPGLRNAVITPVADEAYVLADKYAGVLALLALTGAVVAGLVAALRGPLNPAQRLLVQGVHRAASTAAVGALFLHIVIKVVADEVSLGQAVVPVHALTGQSGHVVAVGLGSLAAYLLLFVVATGVARGWFAGTGRPVRWRIMHSMAYACWFFSAWHGLTAGRHPAAWVTLSYVVCGALCAVVVVVRLVERQRRRGRSMTSTGSLLKAGVPASPARPGGGAHAASGAFPLIRPADAGKPAAADVRPVSGLGYPAGAGPMSGAGLVGGAQAARADLARSGRTGEWTQVAPAAPAHNPMPTPTPSPMSTPTLRPTPVPPAAPSAPVAPRQGPRAPKATPTGGPVPAPAGARQGSRPRRRGRGRDDQGVSDEAFWAFMKGTD